MKRFLALIIIFVTTLFISFYSSPNAFEILKAKGIEAEEFDYTSENEILIFDIKYLDKIIDCLNLEIYLKTNISDRIIIEGYSNKLNDFVVVNNLKVNVQMSIFDDEIILGYPLIDTSFWNFYFLCIEKIFVSRI